MELMHGEVELLDTDYRQLSTVTAVLAEAGCREQLISNVRGVGYMVEDRP